MSSSSSLFTVDTGQKRLYEVEVVHHNVTINGLPTSSDGICFVHLTDIHAGYGNTDPVYEETIARVNAIAPDYLLITGDFIDDHTVREYPLPALLNRFKPKHGTYVTFGNHDHRRGIAETIEVLERCDVTILNNANVQTEQGLWLVGVDDYYEGWPNLQKAFAGVPDDVTPVLLSHNPTMLESVDNRDVLQLSGHTHGGQINLPFPSPRLVIKLHLRCDYVAGWYSRGKARMYLSRGLGVTGKPFRYKCPGEIGVFHLHSPSAGVK